MLTNNLQRSNYFLLFIIISIVVVSVLAFNCCCCCSIFLVGSNKLQVIHARAYVLLCLLTQQHQRSLVRAQTLNTTNLQ